MMGSFIRCICIRDPVAEHLAGTLHRGRIVRCNLGPLLQQGLYDTQCRGLANVVRSTLEREPKNSKSFAAYRPERTVDLPQETVTLLLVDLHDCVQQPEIVSMFPRDSAKCHYVFWKTGSTVADAGIQKTRTNATISADPMDDLIHVRSDRFTD